MLAIPFRIKICGITSTEDLVEAVDAGADAVGLNFYQKSKRYVGDEKLHSPLCDKVTRTISLIGLFVNHSAAEVNRTAAEWGLTWVQLHGDEPPQFLAELDPSRKIMRAYRTSDWQAVMADLAACRAAGRCPDAVLIDAQVAGSYGGTGATADWQAVAQRTTTANNPPVVLAGGLTPENVAEAIRVVRPAAVDVASGVESAPGKKDPGMMRRFVAAANSAWEST